MLYTVNPVWLWSVRLAIQVHKNTVLPIEPLHFSEKISLRISNKIAVLKTDFIEYS